MKERAILCCAPMVLALPGLGAAMRCSSRIDTDYQERPMPMTRTYKVIGKEEYGVELERFGG
ncbi:hypothetical protein [Variovorax paradoxus]|uniref:Uncharacterized protein n=1 Tax=Variovorax paradoxus (strain EPS) TaxID=595537 RepID=E6UZA3_VARPE|nr:hypothetical protein [Variovorax paradoxus]ADU35520.1 hypothetical protein Varpa_1304 [Variovorax paradoxus EPS]